MVTPATVGPCGSLAVVKSLCPVQQSPPVDGFVAQDIETKACPSLVPALLQRVEAARERRQADGVTARTFFHDAAGRPWKHADAFRDAFNDLRDRLSKEHPHFAIVLKPDYFAPWTKENVKEHIWRPIMKAMTGKESTTDLDKSEEITSIHKVIMREMGEKHGVEHIPFPSRDTEALKRYDGHDEMDETNRADKF